MKEKTLHSGYDPNQVVSEEQIFDLLNAAFSMPTGMNQRALDFYIVTDRQVMEVMKGGNPYSQALDSAPCIIVIAGNTNKAIIDDLLEMDAGIAAGAVLIQAADLGLCTCVLSIAPQIERMESVRTALGMDNSVQPVLMIAVGYPEADAVSGASVSNWNDSQAHWDR